MNVIRSPQLPERPRRTDRLLAASTPTRHPPSARRIALRRFMVNLAKLGLPLLALALLGAIALWPEIVRIEGEGKIAFRRAFNVEPDSGRMREPHHRGVDQRGRPYTLTADWASQTGPSRVELGKPKGDMLLESGSWLMVEADEGVYMQHTGQLDLSKNVVMYREDGTVVRTQTAAVELKQGAAASNDQTHVEGPFGVLDAQGFMLTEKGAVLQFTGPARLILNRGGQ